VTYRVIQWATGQLGAEAVAGIIGHPELELVGAWVHTADKAGRDIGELCGLRPLGLVATTDRHSLLATPADCVCYMGGRSWTENPMATVDDLAGILRTGKNVVNTTWPALVYPQALGDEVFERLHTACLEGGSTLYTSGIDPGYGCLGLALTALNVTREVRSVRTYEILNYASWDHPEMITLFGFGQPDEDKCLLFAPGYTKAIFGSSLTLLARALGLELDDVVEGHSVIYADEPFDVASIHIPAGTISGARFEVKGMVDGRERVAVEHVTKLRDEDFPDVPFAGYRAEVDGEPHIRLDMALSSLQGDPAHAAYVACAMAVVNAIPQVCRGEPGILSHLDLLPHPSINLFTT
jgi:hypothetical protein